MISIDRLEEMAIEEFETKLNSWKEQVELQSNFIDSLLKATNNSEWLDKTILDDEASEIIEKIELDYVQLDHLKAENDELKRYKSLFEKARDLWNEASKTNYKLLDEIENLKDSLKRTICQSECYRYKEAEKLKQTLTEIKEIAEAHKKDESVWNPYRQLDTILQKISECEGNDGL